MTYRFINFLKFGFSNILFFTGVLEYNACRFYEPYADFYNFNRLENLDLWFRPRSSVSINLL